jgi:hypothetical protein
MGKNSSIIEAIAKIVLIFFRINSLFSGCFVGNGGMLFGETGVGFRRIVLVTWVPQFEQKLFPATSLAPHLKQNLFPAPRFVPHFGQTLASFNNFSPQFLQCIIDSPLCNNDIKISTQFPVSKFLSFCHFLFSAYSISKLHGQFLGMQ